MSFVLREMDIGRSFWQFKHSTMSLLEITEEYKTKFSFTLI